MMLDNGEEMMMQIHQLDLNDQEMTEEEVVAEAEEVDQWNALNVKRQDICQENALIQKEKVEDALTVVKKAICLENALILDQKEVEDVEEEKEEVEEMELLEHALNVVMKVICQENALMLIKEIMIEDEEEVEAEEMEHQELVLIVEIQVI